MALAAPGVGSNLCQDLGIDGAGWQGTPKGTGDITVEAEL